MTAKTHVLGSMSLALGGYILMDKGGLLIPDVEPLIQLGIILPYSVWASTVPDLDQAHDSVAQSSPINLLIQRFFKIVKAGHRSVKSHVAPAFISLARLSFIVNMTTGDISILREIQFMRKMGTPESWNLEVD